MQHLLIETQKELDRFCIQSEQSPCLAVDTEFMRDRSYFPKLCLLQLATENELVIVDPFKIQSYDSLKKLFCSPGVVKILHSAQQDMEVFAHEMGITPAPIYDSQIAATFLGLKNQIGYADLVKQELQVRLDKSHTRTDWERRPLSEKQLDYAANDVRYLIDIYRRQTAELDSLGRLGWYQDELDRFLLTLAGTDELKLWRRVKGSQSLKGLQLNILKELAIWRESIAKIQNRPRQFILKDDVLIDLVKLKPKTKNDLQALRRFPSNFAASDTGSLLDTIQKAMEQDKSEWPKVPEYVRLSKKQEAIADTLMSIIKICASENNLATELIATRKDIEAVIAKKEHAALLTGWRYEVAGEIVQKFLAGELKISVQNDELQLS